MSDNVNPYSLWEILVAGTNADASVYNDPVELYKDQIFTVTPVHDTDEQRDSGAVSSFLSVPTHGELTVQSGGIPFAALVEMVGMSTSTSGAVVTLDYEAGTDLPYFGAIGVAPTEDNRFLAIGLYKAKLSAVPSINFDGTTNSWNVSEGSGVALAKASVRKFHRMKIYDTLTDWETAKPTTGAEFLSFFS